MKNFNVFACFLGLAFAAIAGLGCYVCFAQNGCPNVGVESKPCINESPYDDGACRIDALYTPEAGYDFWCAGGRLSVSNISQLKFGTSNSQIVGNESAPCYKRVGCGDEPTIVTGPKQENDMEYSEDGGQTVVLYRCSAVTTDTSEMSYKIGPCYE